MDALRVTGSLGAFQKEMLLRLRVRTDNICLHVLKEMKMRLGRSAGQALPAVGHIARRICSSV